MELEAKKKSDNPFDYYTRRGGLYRVYVNWVYMDLTRGQFETLLANHGLKLNPAEEPVCPVTGIKKALTSGPEVF